MSDNQTYNLLFTTPKDIMLNMAKNIKQTRLNNNITQELLVKKSGVSLGSLKRFENSGEISVKNLTLLAIALGKEGELFNLFKNETPLRLADVAKAKKIRTRGRIND